MRRGGWCERGWGLRPGAVARHPARRWHAILQGCWRLRGRRREGRWLWKAGRVAAGKVAAGTVTTAERCVPPPQTEARRTAVTTKQRWVSHPSPCSGSGQARRARRARAAAASSGGGAAAAREEDGPASQPRSAANGREAALSGGRSASGPSHCWSTSVGRSMRSLLLGALTFCALPSLEEVARERSLASCFPLDRRLNMRR